MASLVFRTGIVIMLLCGSALAQRKYTGPRPPKPDIPYLAHPGKLIETEVATAKESQEKDGQAFAVPGETTNVRTPVPEPIFLFQSDKINPDRLTLFKMEVKGGNRVLILPQAGKRKKDATRPLFLMVTPLAPALFKVEVNEFLADGEYCLSPEGSNQVFCFTTY